MREIGIKIFLIFFFLLIGISITIAQEDTSFTVTLPAGYTYAHFNLTGIAGGIAHDTSGNGNDGTIYGAKWVDGALSFDGVDDYVDCGNDESLNITDAITIEAWVKTTDYTALQSIVCQDDGTNRNFNLEFDGSGNLEFVIWIGGISEIVETSASDFDNAWKHVVGTYDGSKMNLYFNGAEVAENPSVSGNIDNDPADTTIGARATQIDRGFNGTIDEVRVYNRALNETEIQNNYNGLVTRNGLVGEWTFDYGPSSQQNVTPEGQSYNQPFYNITNTGNVNLTVKMKINATIPNVILKADTDNNPAGAKEINTTYAVLCEDLPAGNSINIWLWTDLSHAEEQETEKELTIDVSSIYGEFPYTFPITLG